MPPLYTCQDEESALRGQGWWHQHDKCFTLPHFGEGVFSTEVPG
jgi:hypothetical protein